MRCLTGAEVIFVRNTPCKVRRREGRYLLRYEADNCQPLEARSHVK